MKVIRYTIFESNPEGNGAEKRTAQIKEIIDNAGIDSVYIKKDEDSKIKLKIVLLRAISILKSLIKIIPLSSYKNYRSIFKAIRDYIRTEITLQRDLNSNATVFLWECTRSNNFYIPAIIQKYNKRLIAFPHNIESLVPNQYSSISGKIAPHWFDEEIKYLSKSYCSFCISKEETWLLRLYGINAYYLPYYPTKKVTETLLDIRNKRSNKTLNTNLKKILILGSANNPPTVIGMENRIDALRNSKIENIQLIIAGYKTEILSEYLRPSDNIILKGTLSTEQLNYLLSEVTAILIHQSPTTGAIIKIPEMLIAGIPVIANYNSTRTYNFSGIYSYDNDSAFYEILNSGDFPMPPIPEKPIAQIQEFLNIINSEL